MTIELSQRRCQACEGGIPALSQDESQSFLEQLAPRWNLDPDSGCIKARFTFRNYHEVMAFANAVAFIAHRENHHPDMLLSYRDCTVTWITHAAQGLTENDFICAAKVDALLHNPTE